jgi:DNA-binding MarR family transcriptional regulator
MPEVTDTKIGETLHRLLHAYRRALREAYEQGGIALTVVHIRALKSVAGLEDCTAQAIALHTQLDKAQITRALNDLCAEGLIEKQSHPSDGRSSVLALTPPGRALARKIRKLESQAGAQMARGLGARELTDFVRLADRMLDNLSE